jgi:tRNA threonylcarbamoyladenosine biosynthesis protein TsaB
MAERLLILETSGRVGQVALADGETLRGVRRLDEARRHARDLAPAVHELLAEAHWTAKELDAVFVSRGPGSYTGLRVGIMSAKALAYATRRALLAIDTFAAIAHQAPAEAIRIDVLADAQQERVYVQRFARSEHGLRAESALAIHPLNEWLQSMDESVWLTGPGVRVYEARLGGRRLVAADLWDPRPQSLLHLGLDRLRNGERDDMWQVEPLYLRPSAAEQQWTK